MEDAVQAPPGAPGPSEPAPTKRRRSRHGKSRRSSRPGSRSGSRSNHRSLAPLFAGGLAIALAIAVLGLAATWSDLQSANTALATVTTQLRNERLARGNAEHEAEDLPVAAARTSAGASPSASAILPPPLLAPIPAKPDQP